MSRPEPSGVVVHDHDADRLIDLPALTVQHDGRTRRLELRLARGVIRDIDVDHALPQLLGEPEPIV